MKKSYYPMILCAVIRIGIRQQDFNRNSLEYGICSRVIPVLLDALLVTTRKPLLIGDFIDPPLCLQKEEEQ